MALIVAIDMIVVGVLVGIVLTKGFESALPFFAFAAILLPGEARIELPGLFELTATRVAIVALAMLYLVFGNKHPRSGRSDRLPLKYLLTLYLGWCLVATLNSVVFTISLKTVLSNILDYYLVYFIFVKTISEVRTIHKILYASVAALTVCCVFGWIQAYFGWDVINLFPMITHRFSDQGYMVDNRIQSTFPHSILFANALALGIPWALYLLTLAKSRWQRAYLWLAILLMFWNIYKTLSRGPWLGLMLSILVLLVFSQAKIRKYVVLICLLTISVIVIRPGVWDTLRNTYFETLDADSPRGSSYQYRYDLMSKGRETLAKDPSRALWGFGPESFYYLHLEGEDPLTGHTVPYESCDSAMVGIMVETGYVGLLLVIALVTRPTLVSLREFTRQPKPANLLCLVLFVNLVAYIFMMISVENFGWGQQSYMLWILMAFSMVYGDLVRSEVPVEQGERSTQSQEIGRALAGPTGLGNQVPLSR